MQLISKINTDNTHGGNFTIDRVQNDWNITTTIYKNNFVKPFWDGTNWVEAATDAEITLKRKPIYILKIEDSFSYLYIRALASSMNKSNLNLSFLLAQREEYQDKYDCSLEFINSNLVFDGTLSSLKNYYSNILNLPIDDEQVISKTDLYFNTLKLITGEMEDEFSESVLNTILPTLGVTPEGNHLNKMLQLIIAKFKYGKQLFDNFMRFIRRYRTKCFTWVDLSEWIKIEQALSLVKSIPNSLTLTEAEDLYTQFNNI